MLQYRASIQDHCYSCAGQLPSYECIQHKNEQTKYCGEQRTEKWPVACLKLTVFMALTTGFQAKIVLFKNKNFVEFRFVSWNRKVAVVCGGIFVNNRVTEFEMQRRSDLDAKRDTLKARIRSHFLQCCQQCFYMSALFGNVYQ